VRAKRAKKKVGSANTTTSHSDSRPPAAYPQTNSVQEILVVNNVGVLFGDISTSLQEHSIGHPHDGRLVNGGDLVPTVLGSVVEGVSSDSLGGFVGDKLDGLYDTGNELWACGRGMGESVIGSDFQRFFVQMLNSPRARYQSTLPRCFL